MLLGIMPRMGIINARDALWVFPFVSSSSLSISPGQQQELEQLLLHLNTNHTPFISINPLMLSHINSIRLAVVEDDSGLGTLE